MGLYGWRLIGVTGTILVYVAGIIFLSVSNIPGPHHPKRVRISRFGEVIILLINDFLTMYISKHFGDVIAFHSVLLEP